MNSRIDKEISICKEDFKIQKRGVNLLTAFISGPGDTPYEGGKFELEIKLPENYPFDPPDIKFVTSVWHPNISSVTGVICMDILKSNKWSPALNLMSVLVSIQSLLSEPIPEDPQDGVVAQQYLKSKEEFENTARYWTSAFAIEAT